MTFANKQRYIPNSSHQPQVFYYITINHSLLEILVQVHSLEQCPRHIQITSAAKVKRSLQIFMAPLLPEEGTP